MFTSDSHQVNHIHDEMHKKFFTTNLLLFHFELHITSEMPLFCNIPYGSFHQVDSHYFWVALFISEL